MGFTIPKKSILPLVNSSVGEFLLHFYLEINWSLNSQVLHPVQPCRGKVLPYIEAIKVKFVVESDATVAMNHLQCDF